jgi:hypothetical protein
MLHIYIYAKILRSGVADYAIFLITLYDITFQWWSNTHNSNQNLLLGIIFFKKLLNPPTQSSLFLLLKFHHKGKFKIQNWKNDAILEVFNCQNWGTTQKVTKLSKFSYQFHHLLHQRIQSNPSLWTWHHSQNHQEYNAVDFQCFKPSAVFSLFLFFFFGLLKHFAISQQADIKHDHNHNLISVSALECLIRMCINAPSLLKCFMPHHTISTLTKQSSFLLNEILVHENLSQF